MLSGVLAALATADRTGLRGRLLSRVRDLVLLANDPIIEHRVGQALLQLPLSHSYPRFKHQFPGYSENVGRLAKQVSGGTPLRMIDVGANIGDTVAIVSQYADAQFLCIEGAAGFSKLLRANVPRLGRPVEVVDAYLGERSGVVRGSAVSGAGTGEIVQSASGAVKVSTLDEVLKAHPEFVEAGLLKVDTDGFDDLVLRGSAEFLARAKPVIFFEHDVRRVNAAGRSASAIFSWLAARGYDRFLFYDNLGVPIALVEADSPTVEALSRYGQLTELIPYFDVAAFPKTKSELGREFYALEQRRSSAHGS